MLDQAVRIIRCAQTAALRRGRLVRRHLTLLPDVPATFYPRRVERVPDRIAWLALCVVDEAAERAETERVTPTLGLRLALAYLCSIADGPIFALPSRRYVFDHFWKEATAERGHSNPDSERYTRSTFTTGCLQQMGRQLRFGANIFHEVRTYRSPEVPARQKLVNAAREIGKEREHMSQLERQHHWGPPKR